MFTDEMQRRIVSMYINDRMSASEIAQHEFCSATAVKRILRLNRVKVRDRRERQLGRAIHLSPDEIDRTIELYQSGLSAAEVGRALGISEGAVRGRLETAGVKLRTRAEAFKLHRRVVVAHDGERALTPRQRDALSLLDQHGRLSTIQLAERMSTTSPSVKSSLYQLEAMGLVTSRRSTGPGAGLGRPNLWSRTGLRLVDVADHALTPTFSGKPGADDALPIGPFRALLERWIAEEERKVRFMAVAGVETGADGSGGLPSVGTVARALGIEPRRLHAFRFEQDVIAFQTADRLLQISGRPERMEDLWPHLAVEDAA